MKQFELFVANAIATVRCEITPYSAGYDCGKNGPNGRNCHFGLFCTAENTREWERGKRDAEVAKEPEAKHA
ncbi:MAG TPA: hypothetical protein VKQ11_00655 [Candidatus Sulfotelmatobacter sp.]|nr:hypothetical protein [Candidatus Sulfotelmatobacter sp.]